MKRTALTLVAILAVATVSFAGTASAVDCTNAPSYDAMALYESGDRVTHDDGLWEAQLATRAAEPTSGSAYWSRIGDCTGGDDPSTPTPAPTDTPTETATPTPTATATPTDTPIDTPVDDQSPAWDPGATYTSGDRVTHDGQTWEAEWWTRGDEPGTVEWGAWTAVDGGTPTPTPTPTSTDTPTATPTETPTDTPTATPDQPSEGNTTFAPYNHVGTNPDTAFTTQADNAGTNDMVLAFMLADPSGEAAWDGDSNQNVGEAGMASRIDSLQAQDGEVIISFGGAVGTPLAQSISDEAALKAEYVEIIETYGVTHFDFDIESTDTAAVERRNRVMADLQSQYPDLDVSFTLRTSTQGLLSHGYFVVEDAAAKGVDVSHVNVMTMNYGWVDSDAETVTSSASGLHEDLGEIYPDKSAQERWQMVGITPMIGVQNSGGPHERQDAREVRDFVEQNDVGFVSFWSVDRDNGDCPDGSVSPTCSGIAQEPYEFSEIYNDADPDS